MTSHMIYLYGKKNQAKQKDGLAGLRIRFYGIAHFNFVENDMEDSVVHPSCTVRQGLVENYSLQLMLQKIWKRDGQPP